jgi:peptide/nickel transport system substrate-binding protein
MPRAFSISTTRQRSEAVLRRREFLQVLAISAAGTLGSACAVGAPAVPTTTTAIPPTAPPTTSPAAAPTAAQAPRRGGTLRMGIIGDFASLDPHRGVAIGQARDTLARVWDHLVRYDEHLVPQPSLAESWQLAPDATSLSIKLRQGVKFHTGRELTSDDIKWNFDRSRDPKISPIQSSSMKAVASIETPDPLTVVFNFSQSWPWVFDIMNNVYIIDPVTMQASDGPNKPVGTGAFKVAEYAPGQKLRLVRKEQYWRQDRPYVDELDASIYGDAQSMVVAFEAGSLDVISSAPVRDQTRLRDDPKYQVVVEPYAGSAIAITCNVTEPPLDNKQIRQALNYAIDRERILSAVRLGLGQVVTLPFAPSSPAYDEASNKAYAFDLDKAHSLLTGAGVGNLSLDLTFAGPVPGYSTIAQIYAEDLAKIGVTLNLKSLEGAAMSAALNGRTFHGLALSNTTSGQFNPGIQFISPFYGPLNAYSGYAAPDYADLMNRVATEADPAKQKQVYQDFNKTALDLSINMPIVTAPLAVVASNKVHGIAYAMNESLETTGIWLDA